MTNKIIFTQDVPGEREWLSTQFPEFNNLETEFSGKWPAVPFTQDSNTLWEVPPDSLLDVSTVNCTKYKSLYQLDTSFVSSKWCEADHLLINDLKFEPQPRAKKAQVLTFSRCGTVFLESILYKKCGYDKNRQWNPLDPTADHVFLGSNDTDAELYKLVNNVQPDIFLCYRANWWAWAISVLISKHFDYYHYQDNVAWDAAEPVTITIDELDTLVREVRANWQSLCHFRTQFTHLNFYIFEFSELIKNNHLTQHRAISYNKKRLISNYDQLQTVFEALYQPKFELWQKNCIGHLQTMGCQVSTNFDKFFR